MHEPIVFVRDSGLPFLAIFGLVPVAMGVLIGAVVLRKQLEGGGDASTGGSLASAWFLVAFLGLVGGYLSWSGLTEAMSVALSHDGQAIDLKFAWPRGVVTIDTREIAAAHAELRGTKRPSPHLVIDLRDGGKYEGEGTSDHESVAMAVQMINAACAQDHLQR